MQTSWAGTHINLPPAKAQLTTHFCWPSWLHLDAWDCAEEGSPSANCLNGSQLPCNWLPYTGCSAAGGSPHNRPAELAQHEDGATLLGKEHVATRISAHRSFCAKPDISSACTVLLQMPLLSADYQYWCFPNTKQGLPGSPSLCGCL